MVDTVLYLEGDSSSNIRMLRASKNRFGASDEVGVYEMTAGRLLPVSDPSSLFLAMRDEHADQEGCAIAVYVISYMQDMRNGCRLSTMDVVPDSLIRVSL